MATLRRQEGSIPHSAAGCNGLSDGAADGVGQGRGEGRAREAPFAYGPKKKRLLRWGEGACKDIAGRLTSA